MEDTAEQEPETGRRPSRRAAREAAKKIYNTVCKYGSGGNDPNDPDVLEVHASLKAVASPRSPAQRQRQKSYQNIRLPPPNIDLLLECHEELLSTVQAEALLQAQLQYNMVMKTLRNLKASNVRIVVAPADPVVSESSSPGTSNPSGPEEAQTSNAPDDISSEKDSVVVECKREKIEDLSMELATEAPSPAPILS